MLRSACRQFKIFLEMIKVEHSIFALPFAYLGLFLAQRALPSARLFWLVTLAMVSFRTMGMGLNRLLDNRIDALNPRTSERALPAKKLSVSFVWSVTLGFGALFVWTTSRINPLCLKLAIIPICLSFLYPLAKRFTWFSHGLLGIILGIAPYGAWIASRESFSWIPGWIFLGVASWVAGFDIIYALQDEAFDREHKLYSVPAVFGSKIAIHVTQGLHIITMIAWVGAGVSGQFGWIYFLGLLVVAGVLIREHWLIEVFGISKIQEAFFGMNAVVSLTVFIFVLGDIFLGS